jgi:hypothetical protein
MMQGAAIGAVAMAGGRVIGFLISGKAAISSEYKQTAMAALTGGATGAVVMMLLSSSPGIGNILGDYTESVALAGSVAAANYYFDRSSFKNALSGM